MEELVMKNFLFAIICCLVSWNMSAQTLSGNKVVDGLIEETDIAEVEQAVADMGINAKIRFYFDKNSNELVMEYRFFDEKVYNTIDANEGLIGAIGNMIGATMKEEDSGNFLVWMGNEFKRTNTGIRVDYFYKNKKKSASATADEIQKVIMEMWQ